MQEGIIISLRDKVTCDFAVGTVDREDIWPCDVVFLKMFTACGNTNSLEGVTQPHISAYHIAESDYWSVRIIEIILQFEHCLFWRIIKLNVMALMNKIKMI